MSKAKNALALILCSVVIVLQAAAADADSSDSPEAIRELDTITVTASRRERPLKEVANSISVFEADDISQRLAADIKDISRYTPWLSAASDPSRFGLSGFSIRGLGANRIATEIDGVPVASGFSVGSYASSGRNAVNPAMVKRIEVLRGPASSLYGSDALGGIVSYSTFDPDDFLPGHEDDHYLGLRTTYDGRDQSFATTLMSAADLKHSSVLVGATVRNGHETQNRARLASARPNPRSYDQTDFSAKLVRQTRAGELTLALDGRSTHTRVEVDDVEGTGRFASTSMLTGNDRYRRHRISVGGRKTLSGEAIAGDIDWSVYFQESLSDQRSSERREASSRAPSPTLRFPEFQFEERVVGTSLTAAREWRAAGQRHRLLAGLQFEVNNVDELRDNRLVNLDSGAVSKTVLGETFPVRDFPTSRITEAGAFVHDEIIFGNGRFTLIPGMRAEHYKLDPKPDQIYLEDNPNAAPVSIDELSFAPKLGSVLQIDDKFSVFFQYARGFRSPPFEDANIGLEIPLFNVRAIPNPNLQAETSNGFEIGLRYGGDKLRGSVSAYRNRYKNFIDSKVNLGPDPETGVLIFQSLNRERSVIEGIEGEVSYDLDALLEGSWMSMTFARTRGNDESRQVPLNSIDPDRAVLSFAYDHPTQRWGTELIATFTDAKKRTDESNGALFAPPGNGLLDLFAYYQLARDVRINLALLNLTHRRHWEWADVRGRAPDDPLLDFYTRPGTSFAASVSMQW